METQTLTTVLDFVGNGTSGVDATGSSATADPLFALCAILVALIGVALSLFVYSRFNKKAITSFNAKHSTSNQSNNKFASNAKGSKLLVVILGVILATTCFSICNHNSAIADETAQNDSIAAVSDKVTANVDEAGNVTFDKGFIKNDNTILAIGVRQVKSDTTVDLSDAILQIKCGENELYSSTLGSTQTNGSYVKVPLGATSDLTYTVKMPAEKAKQLIGTQPVTINTVVDLICTRNGIVNDGGAIENADVTYSYIDPYDTSSKVEDETTTDKDGKYSVADIKKGCNVDIEINYETGSPAHARSIVQSGVKFDDESDLPSGTPKYVPQVDDLVLTKPTDLTYSGTAKTATFAGSTSCPAVINATAKYSSDGETWTTEAPVNAGTYYVMADVAADANWNAKQLVDKTSWQFTIAKANPTLNLSSASAKYAIPAAGSFTYTYNGDGQVSVSSDAETVATASVDTSSKKVTVTPIAVGTAKITVSAAEGTNYKAVSAEHTATVVNCYSGTVKLFSVDDTTGTGLSGAKVLFTKDEEQEAAQEVTTGSDGKFAFTTVAEKTAGTIKVTYTDTTHTDDVYSVATKTTDESTTAALGDFEIRKLTSLAVTIKSKGSDLKTHWCPAFADGALTKSSVKFYDKNFCETDGTATVNKTTDYKMNDLKDGGWYYAFVTTGVTIRCYQISDQTWNSTFKFNSETGSYPQTANSLVANWNSDGSVCSDKTAKTVYFDGTDTEKSQWAPFNVAPSADPPSLNDVSYSTDSGNGGWYAAYGGNGGGVLSDSSKYPWSAVASNDASNDKRAFDWFAGASIWVEHNRGSDRGVVVSQAFSNATFDVDVQPVETEYGSISIVGSFTNIPYGTNYKVEGNKITIKTGASSEPTITYTPDTSAKYKLKNWAVSTDEGANWTPLTDGSTYILTAKTKFKAVTEAISYYSGTVKAIDSPGASAAEKDGIKVKFTPTDSTIEAVEATTANGGKYALTGIEAGTAGKLSVVGGTDSTPYSAETTEIASGHSATLDTITTTKLTSLQVTITDKNYNDDHTEYVDKKRNTCWCPVIADGSLLSSANVKFYDYNRELISDKRGDSTDGYSMKDIACPSDKKGEGAGAAYKYQANYFAWCSTTHESLNCFQTVSLPWTDVFTVDSTSEAGATSLSTTELLNRIGNWKTESDVDTVYKSGGTWVSAWRDSLPSDGPKVRNYKYSRKDDSDKELNLVDIYGNVKTESGESHKDESGVLSQWAYYPWSARSRDSYVAYYWFSRRGDWVDGIKDRDYAVVVQQAFS